MRTRWLLVVLVLAAAGLWWLTRESGSDGEPGLLPGAADEERRIPVLEGRALSADPAEPQTAPKGPCVLEGTVESAEGELLVGVEVRLERRVERGFLDEAPGRWLDAEGSGAPERHEEIAATRTAADGSFAFRGLSPSVDGYRVRALAAPPWAPAIAHPYYLTDRAFVRLVLVRGESVRLRVVDETGAGLRAVVSGWREREIADWVPCTFEDRPTDAEGRVTLVLPEGAFQLSVRAPGVGWREGVLLETPQSREVVIALGVPGGAGVEGRTADTSGQPVSGARILVSAVSVSDVRLYRLGTSGADGTYRIDGLPAGRLDLLGVTAAGFVTVEQHATGRELRAGAVVRADVTMVRGGVLEGTVRGPDGQVVVGARVEARAEHAREGLAGSDRAVTDAEGRYRMTAVPLGGGHVRVAATGFYQLLRPDRDTTWYLIEGETDRKVLDVVLARGVPVAGRVVDTTGRPVAGAGVLAEGVAVGAWWAGLAEDRRLVTDADGRFAYPGLPPAKWSLSAQTADELSLPRVVDTMGSVAVPARLELVLRPGAAIEGRVVADGRDVTGLLRVQARPRQGGSVPTVPLRADGTFAVRGLPPGDYEVAVVDWQLARVSAAVTRTLGWGQVERDVVLETRGLGVVAGVVVDEGGEPVPGLDLRLDISTPGRGRSLTTQSSLRGRFAFEGVPDEGYAFPIYVRNVRQPGTFKPGDTDVRLVVAAPETARFEGTVFLPDGSPAPTGRVMLWEVLPGGGRNGRTVPIVDGVFGQTVERTAPDSTFGAEVREVFDVLGRIVSTQPLVFEPVVPGEPLEFRLVAGLEIQGTVVDADGAPVAGVRVSLVPRGERLTFRHKNMDSRADGSFQFGALAEGAFELHVARVPAPWIAPPPLSVRAGEKGASIRLLRGGAIRGRVLAPDGSPLTGALVSWNARGGRGKRATSGDGGEFELSPIPQDLAGSLTATPPEGAAVPMVGARVDGVRAGADGLELRLGPGAFIDGVVTGPGGEAVTEGTILCGPATQPGSTPYVVQLGGTTFRIGPLPPGRYHITAQGQGAYLRAERIEVEAPAEGVRIVLPKGLTIAGTIVGAQRPERLSLEFARMTPDGPSTLGGSVLASGQFSVTLREDDVGTLYVHDREGGDLYGLVENARPSPTPVRIELQAGATIEGRIEPYAEGDDGYVYLQASSGLTIHAQVARDGSFVVRAVPPGTYDIHGIAARRTLVPVKGAVAGTKDHVLRQP